MNKLKITVVVLSLILAGLIVVAVSLPVPQQPQPPVPSTQLSTGTHDTVPTATPVTQATVDYDRLAQQIAAWIPQEEGLDAQFAAWLGEYFGRELLLQINTDEVYDRSVWYDLTGNTYHTLRWLWAGSSERVIVMSAGRPGAENETIRLVFGGDICLADNYLVMQHLASVAGTIADGIDPALISIMQEADVTFLNNEFTISDRGTPMAGKAYTFRAAVKNTAIYNELGVDIVSLANNHAFDFGEEAFLDTLDALAAYEVAQIGGGRNLSEALMPQYYIIGGRKIAYIAATRAEKNIMTPAAGEDSPGVLRCYDTALVKQAIAEAEQNCDYVILCVHWGTEYSYTLEEDQITSAREYIEAGADLIVGAHAHQLQGIEYYNGKPIFYNLGNFWFNAYDIETGLLQVELDHGGQVQCNFIPAYQSGCVTTAQIGTDRGQAILETLRRYSPGVCIDENGVITQKVS